MKRMVFGALSGAVLTFALGLILAPGARAAAPAIDAGALYVQHCQTCHGVGRLGGMGPALLPENLHRTGRKKALAVIADGRTATQMPPFKTVLRKDQIAALRDFIFTPPAVRPTWDMDKIKASYVLHNDPAGLPPHPVYKGDPLNLFTVVEAGDHHVTILDGDTFTPLWRFPSRFALHGGAKYSPDGRFVYLGSRDGWVSMYDLYNLKPVAEIRAGINMRNIAVSADGRYVLAGNYLPHSLVLLNAKNLRPIKEIKVEDAHGVTSRVSAVYTAPPRHSFIVALKDIPEIWEISYEDHPRPVAKGMIHSYEKGMLEGAFDTGKFPIRRIKLASILDDFFFDQGYDTVVGASRNGKGGQVINLNVGLKIADIDLPGMPHLGSGITFTYKGRPVMATPHLKDGVVSVIDMTTWKTIKRIKTLGPGFFMRGHKNSPYAWVDVFFGPNRDAMQVIDTRTLKIVKTLRPAPGKTSAHVEFDRSGAHALVSIWDTNGAIVVYDAKTFKEVKRIPMKKPVGKYNVYNKITYSRGTSH
ncbi:cytochrome D1 domain-containing protein [Varunaivibrio sulfuroxidans]|uniref:Mono/diheme cytochrome c family protein n=1 Tax=Varunaivibrio sulfuroxidans TaxID=1773489 RepID=A0A4R3J9Z1_9PROT|nr:cytochrome D1 domain-containing protein [Varunaivibrio sulfuroxidans]TCS61793.1 mono/diheme cytochrome c family protein [Varunaivibrio sulfuroxidans]WES32024.1 cytochrome D1 domain-containing protein [Varunaivibrio sulfuroxidans]